ncbi:MAG: T9SS type A sorting domain-containing protein [Bacteroidia bacterium]|nr:T9SS type A sorting domain-containing protein [Bacteroidia bacterium]
MTFKHYLFLFSVLYAFTQLKSQNKVSNASGTWTNPAIWTPTGVPTSTNNVTISNGNTVTISGNAVCNNLTIGNGAATAQIHFIGGTARTFSVLNNLTVSALATFSVASNSNVTHSLILSGNLINNGTFRLYQDGNSLCNITFNKNGNQSITGTGSLTRFNRIAVNMGTSANNILEVSSSSFTTSANFLTLTNGTFKLSTPNAATVVPFTAATTVQATTGLWLNSPTARMSFSAGVGLAGVCRITSGYFDVGNANNEDLTPNGGTLTVEGGTLDIAGKYNSSSAASTFSFTGGTIFISNNASTNTTISPFHISAAGSSFYMSGGTMILRREGGGGAQDLGFRNTGSTIGSVTGGTIQFGNATTPANQTISINSSFPLPNITINSASVTVKLNTNSLTVVNNISILSGTLQSNNLAIGLGGSWSNAGNFVPGTSTVTFNGAAAQSISKTSGETFNHLLFSGNGLKTFSSSITANGNFSINTGANVDVSASNQTLTLKGHFINSGTFTQRNGLVLLNGTTSQSISGTSASTFYNLTLNNTAGAVLGSTVNLEGSLSLNNGTFNTNSKIFTLISNSLTTGNIAQITGSGDITGNVTVQRFVPGGSTGWAFLGSPISSALTLSDWDDDIYISCSTCPDGYVSGFPSVYTYDETQSGAFDAASSYVALSSINDAIVAGKGYWVYMGNGPTTTGDITLDLTGTVRKFNYTIPLSYSNLSSASDDGWNLITNPYPSAISWAALKGATSNIDNAIYTYNADLNSGTGGYASYVNGVSSPAVGSGGIDDNIPMGQGFYVHSTGATGLNAQESNKLKTNPTFLKSASLIKPIVRLNLLGQNSYSDEAVVYFEQGASNGFEYDFDAYKIRPNDPLAAFIALSANTLDFQINGVAPLNGSFVIPVKVNTGVTGNFTISPGDLSSLPASACVVLYDKWTATNTNLRNSSYAFTLPDSTTVPRFELHVTLNNLNITSQVSQPSCQQPNSGYIAAKGLSAGPWNYTWKNSNGVVVKNSIGLTTADSLKNISGGNFNLEVSSAGLCDFHESQFYLVPQTPVTAGFVGVDSLWLSQSSSVQFTNTSVNSVSSLWYQGFGSQTSNVDSPTFAYNQAGVFNVKLISTSYSGCVDSIQKKIVVIDDLVGLQQFSSASDLVIKTLGKGAYEIDALLKDATDSELMLFDINGKLLETFGHKATNHLSQKIDLSAYPKGVYILRLNCSGNIKTIKLVAD